MCLMSQKSTGAKYSESREPDAYYICMFMDERKKYIKKKIKEEKEKEK